MANLYEISNDIEMLLESDISVYENLIDNETGEIVSVGELLDRLEMDQKTKIENIALYIKNLSADVEAMKNEEKKLAERRRVRENQIERLKNYLSMSLQYAGYEKFDTPRTTLSFRTSKAVEISEGATIPEEYIVKKVTEQPDKKALMEALKEGLVLDGIKIVENKNIQIK